MMLFFYFFVVVFFFVKCKIKFNFYARKEGKVIETKKKSIFMKDLKLHPLVESLQDTGQDRDN